MYDLDSELPFPTYFHKYVTETFRTDAILNTEYHRQFRVVPAQIFLETFSSDRRHMRKGRHLTCLAVTLYISVELKSILFPKSPTFVV